MVPPGAKILWREPWILPLGPLPYRLRPAAPPRLVTGFLHKPLVLAISSASFFLYEALKYAPPPLPFAPLIALYTVAVNRIFFTSAVALGGMLLGLSAVALLQNSP